MPNEALAIDKAKIEAPLDLKKKIRHAQQRINTVLTKQRLK